MNNYEDKIERESLLCLIPEGLLGTVYRLRPYIRWDSRPLSMPFEEKIKPIDNRS